MLFYCIFLHNSALLTLMDKIIKSQIKLIKLINKEELVNFLRMQVKIFKYSNNGS